MKTENSNFYNQQKFFDILNIFNAECKLKFYFMIYQQEKYSLLTKFSGNRKMQALNKNAFVKNDKFLKQKQEIKQA